MDDPPSAHRDCEGAGKCGGNLHAHTGSVKICEIRRKPDCCRSTRGGGERVERIVGFRELGAVEALSLIHI